MIATTINQRDKYIDFVKGLAVVSIVFIHTVFFSGMSYVPVWWRNVALLFDVSVFFLMTGCALNFTDISENLIFRQIIKLSATFTTVVIFFQLLFWNFNVQNILNCIFLESAIIPEFPVFSASYWFVPVYIVAIIFASIIIKYFSRIITYVLIISWLYYLLRFFNFTTIDTSFLGQSLNTFLFYTCIVLVGYKFYKQKINKPLFITILIVSLCSHLLLQNKIPNFYLQQYKFPLSYIYINASMISISLIFILKDKISKIIQRHPCKLLDYLGRNCIAFYMSQGISSSLMIKIVPLITLPFGFKLLCAFVLNMVLALIIGIALNKMLYIVHTVFHRLKNKKNSDIKFVS